MTNFKVFFFNGQEYHSNAKFRLIDLLNYFNYQKQFFIVEYNNKIYNQKEWEKITIYSNDKIEIITLVGGG